MSGKAWRRRQKAGSVCFFTCVLLAQAEAGLAGPDTAPDETRLIHIQQAIQSGELHRARIEVQDALQVLPGDPRLYNFLGVIDIQEQRFGDAEANFRRAIKIAPRFTGAYLNLGRLYQEKLPRNAKSHEKALEAYSSLLSIDPDNIEATYQAALLFNRLGRFDSSLHHLARLPGEAQHRAPALSLRCADEAALQHAHLAAASANELLAAPDFTEADVLPIIPTLVQHHQVDLATILLERLVKNGSASAAALEQLALLYQERGQLKEARDTLTKELNAVGHPSVALLSQLAKVAYKSGDLEGTLGYLAHARDLEPGNSAIHFLFGLVCIDLKLPPEAEESLKRAVRLNPRNPYYNYTLGAVLLQRRNPDEAIRCFKNFREVEREDPRGNFALGVAYFDADQVDAARKEFESVATRRQTRAGALLYLGRLAFRQGNLAEAADHLRLAILANPAIAESYTELAQLQIRGRQYQAAEQNLNRALRLAPDDYRANLNLLLLYKSTKDARAEEQSRRVEKMQQAGEERERLLLRSLDIHPY
jgi:tetratricopeptide (TPR) repeat protein